jgi:hypothetical protein
MLWVQKFRGTSSHECQIRLQMSDMHPSVAHTVAHAVAHDVAHSVTHAVAHTRSLDESYSGQACDSVTGGVLYSILLCYTLYYCAMLCTSCIAEAAGPPLEQHRHAFQLLRCAATLARAASSAQVPAHLCRRLSSFA